MTKQMYFFGLELYQMTDVTEAFVDKMTHLMFVLVKVQTREKDELLYFCLN